MRTLVFAFVTFSCILLQGKIMTITKIYVSGNHFWNCVSWCIWNQLSLSYQAPLTNIAWNYFANGVLGCHSYTVPMTSIKKVKRWLELSIRFDFCIVVPLKVSFAVGLDSHHFLVFVPRSSGSFMEWQLVIIIFFFFYFLTKR